jgi:hypothetical protein
MNATNIRWDDLTLERASDRDVLDRASGNAIVVWESPRGARVEYWTTGSKSHWRALRGNCCGWGDTKEEAMDNCNKMLLSVQRRNA